MNERCLLVPLGPNSDFVEAQALNKYLALMEAFRGIAGQMLLGHNYEPVELAKSETFCASS